MLGVHKCISELHRAYPVLTDHWRVNRGVQLAGREAVSSQCGCWPVCVVADVGMS